MIELYDTLGALGLVGLTAWFLIPLASVAVDVLPAFRAARQRVCEITDATVGVDDFEILVPIYGSLRYLENVEYLRAYGSKVVLCTTTEEDPQLLDGLDQLAWMYGFRVFTTHVPGRRRRHAQRSATAPVRDKLIRDALATVTATYVVCIDADTVTERPLEQLIGAFAAHDLDVASVRLLPSNSGTLLARMQGHEYRMAMRMRRLYPWLVSGACHVARTRVHHDIMRRHSLFFQGDDVELGVLADSLGYRVGHIPFDVPTTVPDRWRAWWRQRYAWAGGEFRVYFVNARFAARHPYFYFYGAVVLTLLAPLRWMIVLQHPWVLAYVYAVYLLTFLLLHWRTRDAALLVLPLYTLIITLVLVPLSIVSYLSMALQHHNAGRIRPGRAGGAALVTRSLSVSGEIAVRGMSVSDLQRSLAAVGHAPGPIDGEFGPRTRRALIAWQSELIGLGYDLGWRGADGVFGALTASASQREAPWRGLDDRCVATAEWLGSFGRCGLFGARAPAVAAPT
jgi:hypothetical protein